MKKQNIKIDYAKKQDILFIIKGIKEICKIEKEKPEKNSFLIKKIKEALEKNQIIIARYKDEPIGFVQFIFSNKEPYGFDYGKHGKEYCWIEWIYVLKKYRNEGIGSGLYKNLAKICKNKNIKEIMLDVFEINKHGQKFYFDKGFKPLINILVEKLK